jgi:hypothetical protein
MGPGSAAHRKEALRYVRGTGASLSMPTDVS